MGRFTDCWVLKLVPIRSRGFRVEFCTEMEVWATK